MKFKTLLLPGILLILLFSCEKRDETNSTEIDTELNIDISVIVKDSNSPSLKSVQTDEFYSFTGTSTFSLSDCDDIKNCINDIQKIHPNVGCVLSFLDITNENEIYTLNLEWGYLSLSDGHYNMENPVDILSYVNSPNNGRIEISLDNVLIPLINCIDCNPDCLFLLNVKGTSASELSSIAQLKIPITVETNVFSYHYTLF